MPIQPVIRLIQGIGKPDPAHTRHPGDLNHDREARGDVGRLAGDPQIDVGTYHHVIGHRANNIRLTKHGQAVDQPQVLERVFGSQSTLISSFKNEAGIGVECQHGDHLYLTGRCPVLPQTPQYP